MKNILITGGAGMIGSNLVEKMLNLGYQITVIDNLWRGKLKYLENIDLFNVEKYFHKIDLSNISSNELLDLGDFDGIIHLADIVAGIDYVFKNEGEIFRKNNKINSTIIEYARKTNVKKFIYVGTACSFPKQLQTSKNSVLKEENLFPADPESAYGWSKLVGSLEMRYIFKNTSIQNTTLFLHNVYGPNCDYSKKKSQVIPSLIFKAITQSPSDPLEVWGSGQQSRAFIHVDDVCNAILKTLNCSTKLPEAIQIGPKQNTTISDLAYLIVKKSEIERQIIFDRNKPTGDFGRACDSSLAEKYLSWEEKTSLENGIEDLIKWIKKDIS